MSVLLALAEEIAKRGVSHIFGIPGSGASLTLLDGLEKRGVIFYPTHFEGTAALMAGAQGRLNGKAGAVISIKGPGLANMIPGLAACRLEALPVVAISECYSPGTSLSKTHKRMDHKGLVSAVAKGSRFLSRKGPRFSDLAAWAEQEVPGPVHLDINESEIDEDAPALLFEAEEKGLSEHSRIYDLIKGSERPAVIAGTLALRKNLSSRLNGLRIPVFSVAAAKGVVDETLPHAAGVYTGAGLALAPESSLLKQADMIIGLGLRHNEVLTVASFQCKALNLDPLENTLSWGFGFDHVFAGSPKEWEAAFTALGEKEWGSEVLNRSFERLKEKMLSGGFLPARAFQCIERHFHGHARLVLDTGNFCTIGEHMWRARRPHWYLGSGQGRYMGIGLPMAIGAVLGDPALPTVAVLGDGGIGMFVADIKLAVKYRLPLIVVLMSDGYLGSIRTRSIKDGLTQEPVRVYQPSWIKTMEGLGVCAERVSSEMEMEEVLKGWSPSDGPLYLEIPFDPEAYQEMVRDIR